MSEQHPGQSDGEASAIIDQWFRDYVQGSIVARDVDTYNHVQAAVEDLKKRLAEIGVK